MKCFLIGLLLCAGMPALADMVVPSRTIRPNAIITELDIVLANGDFTHGFDRMSDVVGQEARVALYAGQPIRVDDIGPPALITRNQIVTVSFAGHGLRIATEGRALERGAIGDRVRVMNLSSRATVFGQVMQDGTIQVRN